MNLLKYIVLIIGTFIFIHYAHAKTPIPFEPAKIKLQGVLTQESHYGPPNYGQNPKTDSVDKLYVLRLPQPITVGTPDSISAINTHILKNIQTMQIISDCATKLQSHIGHKIEIHGSISIAISGRHYLPVLLTIDTCKDILVQSK